ncbi:MAG: hypothetical protein IJ690_02030 [Clostridia bacterium]|nr:hypothetical protein [Clostridia bacterium]MBR1653720.1 hypothetical protein [Clostridia bacterium]
MKKPKEKYLVIFSDNDFYETWAVSEKQAINNVKYQLGLAGSYEYHNKKPIEVELVYRNESEEN